MRTTRYTHGATHVRTHINISVTYRVTQGLTPKQLPHTTHAVGGREANIVISIVSVQSVQSVANGGARTRQFL